jgi:oxygen-independent coproporphyrinogen-3 oxidase
VTAYLQRIHAGQSPAVESEILSPADAARERLVFGLRRLEGVSLTEFARQTGFDVAELVGAELERFVAQGLLELTVDRLRLTRQGLLVSDSIWPAFL